MPPRPITRSMRYPAISVPGASSARVPPSPPSERDGRRVVPRRARAQPQCRSRRASWRGRTAPHLPAGNHLRQDVVKWTGGTAQEEFVPEKGLEEVVAAQTKLSDIDGKLGRLSYVGYDIHDLATQSTFEEVVFLLHNLRLPTAEELDEISEQLVAEREISGFLSDLMPTLAV